MDNLDLRDLAKELNDLRAMRDDAAGGLCEDDAERLEALESLEGELNGDLAGYADNEPNLIPEEEFEDYARELVYNVGYATEGDENPLHAFIDWAGWAEAIRRYYTKVTFDGDTYLIRAY